MKELELLEKRISFEAFLLASFGCGMALILRQAGVAIGLAVGVLSSILNFKLLVVRAVGLTGVVRPKLFFKFFTSFIFRYAIMGLILWAAINKGLTYFLGVACGLLMVKLAIYIDTFLVPERWKA